VQQADTVGPLTVAVITAVAGLLGAAVGSGATLWSERLRRKREERAAAEENRRELRQAVRIVLAELNGTKAVIRHAAAVQRAWLSDRPLPMDAWRRYRDALALRVSDEAWMMAEKAYGIAAELNQDIEDLHRKERESRTPSVGGVQINLRGLDPTPPLGDKPNLGKLRESFLHIHEAMVSLERELGPKAGVFHYTGYASGEEMWPEGGSPR
jgi:hypothetical protein